MLKLGFSNETKKILNLNLENSLNLIKILSTSLRNIENIVNFSSTKKRK